MPFKFGSISFRFGWRREKEIINLSIPHLDKVLEVVTGLKNLIDAFCEGDIDKAKERFDLVFKAEREADGIKRNIIDELARGPFHPIDREDVLRLIFTIDDIADNAKAAARKLCLSSPNILPEELKKDLIGLAEMICKIVESTKSACIRLVEKPKLAIEIASEVEKLEEDIDEYRVELLGKVLELGEKTGKVGPWLMLKEAIGNMEMVADRSEDVADIIRSISISLAR